MLARRKSSTGTKPRAPSLRPPSVARKKPRSAPRPPPTAQRSTPGQLEENELEKAAKKPDKKANRVAIPVPKVTEAELIHRREEEQKEIARKAEELPKSRLRQVHKEFHESTLEIASSGMILSLLIVSASFFLKDMVSEDSRLYSVLSIFAVVEVVVAE